MSPTTKTGPAAGAGNIGAGYQGMVATGIFRTFVSKEGGEGREEGEELDLCRPGEKGGNDKFAAH